MGWATYLEESMIQLPQSGGGGSSPVQTEPPRIGLLVFLLLLLLLLWLLVVLVVLVVGLVWHCVYVHNAATVDAT